MFERNSTAAALMKLGAFSKGPSQAVLDAAEAKKAANRQATLDAAGAHAAADIRQSAAALVKEWAATGPADYDEGEGSADRLLALAIGVADENKDGDLSEDEANVVEIALNAMADFLVGKGVSEDDAVALLQDTNNEAGDRVLELLAGEGGEDDSDVDSFAFDAESSESVMDGVLSVFDAVYKKKLVIRKGKKIRINKRVSGHVRLSGAQKVAIRKAGLKSRSSSARMHRMKSMKIRKNAGL
jgi:hypothetical protein